MTDHYFELGYNVVSYVSLMWPDPISLQGHYCLQCKHPTISDNIPIQKCAQDYQPWIPCIVVESTDSPWHTAGD